MAAKPSVLIAAHGHPQLAPGGAEIVALELYEALRATGSVEPYFLGAMLPRFGLPHPGCLLQGANDDPHQSLYWSDNYDYFLLAQKHIHGVIEEFGRYIEAIEPRIVHFHHIYLLGVDMIRMVRNLFPQTKILLTLHEFFPICHHNGQMVKTDSLSLCHRASPADCHRCFPTIQSGEFFLRERFIKSHLELVDLFLCPSRFLMQRYADWGLPESKLRYVENGHHAAGRDHPSPPPPKRRTFGYFGQVSPYKGLPVLLKAVRHLLKQGFDDFRVAVHGSMVFLPEDQRAEMTRQLAEVDSHVVFHGAYRPEEVVPLMAAVDFVVVPSIWWENSPLVIQEAFVAKRPVLCSNIGGMAEKVRHEVDGLHFRMGDPVALAETIRRACEEDGLQERMIAAMPPVLSMRQSAEAHLDLYGLASRPIRERVRVRRRSRPTGVPAATTQSP